jgi:membrane-bound metal-dependent hydrolase YbcI (DUF457 family)
MAAVSAGYSLLPDIECENSTADRALGGHLHKLVHKMCAWVYNATGTSRDARSVRWMLIRKWENPYHRTFTHTLLATLALGVLAYGLALTGPVLSASVAAFGVFLLWPLRRGAVGPVVCGAAAAAVGAAVLLNPWLLSLAVAGGYLTHIVGDACTKGGVPALWPLPIQGKRWWNIRLLGSLVASGSAQEKGPAVGVSLTANAFLVFLQF